MMKKFSVLIKGFEELIVAEMADRLKDIVFMQAESKVREAFYKLASAKVRPIDTIEIDYKVTFAIADVIQIIGRKKRG